jgi:hypothetical protein
MFANGRIAGQFLSDGNEADETYADQRVINVSA